MEKQLSALVPSSPKALTHKNSHKITIYRALTFIEKAQQTSNGKQQGAADFLSLGKQDIGGYFASKNSSAPGTGLTLPEIKLLLPDILYMHVDDRDFNKSVKEFYGKLKTDVPYGKGVELEIGLEQSNSEPVSKDNMPINPMEYIRYKHALGHPFVAPSEGDARRDSRKRYYIYDRKLEEKRSAGAIATKDEALTIYLGLKDDKEKVKAMLTLMGTDPRDFTGDHADSLRSQALREMAEKRTGDFLALYNIDNFEERFVIQTMVNTGVLKQIGARFMISSNGETFGNDINEALMVLKDTKSAENQAKISALKATMQDALKEGKRKTTNP